MDEATRDQNVEQSLRTSQKKKKVALVFIIIGVILLAIFGAYYVLNNKKTEKQTIAVPAPTVTTQASQAPSATTTLTATATPTATLSRSNLSIAVENGSGAAGVGSKASAFLKNLGYTIASVGNADNFNYTGVTIQVKPAKSDYLSLLQKDLSGSYTITSATAKLASLSADAVVIVGK